MPKDVVKCICRLWIIMLTVVGAWGLLASAALPARAEAMESEARAGQEVDRMTWDDAMQAYQAADYRKALFLFEILSTTTSDEIMRRRALFAAVSTRFLIARSHTEYLEALAQWESWTRLLPTLSECEDPRLLTPFLIRMTPPAGPGKSAPAPPKAVKSMTYSSLLNCKEALQNREKELEQMRSRLAGRDREIRRLRNQITTLEEIHLKFQEKKQEASSP